MSMITNILLKKDNPGKNEEDILFTSNHLQYAEEIERLKDKVSSAYSNLDYVVDPLLIDSWIYEINAAQLRYQFCLQQLKDSPQREKTGAI